MVVVVMGGGGEEGGKGCEWGGSDGERQHNQTTNGA